MPTFKGPARESRRPPRRGGLALPVAGMEAEFNVWLDGVEIDPRSYWGRPRAFITRPLLKREKSSYQVPTGGAVYFDRGVIEVVTPVIELRPGCAARMVRNLWEQIAFVREELDGWGNRTGHDVRLSAYSAHYNISYEVPRAEQRTDRDVQSLALLLAFILPVPVALVATNRRSTGVGVRPRGDRIEVTVDFTPDPGLMIATAALVIGIVREVLSWESYRLELLDEMPIATVADVVPGRHTTRKGWLTKDFHFPLSPFTTDLDRRIWPLRRGGTASLRHIARSVAWYFRHSIRRYCDPFSFRMLFAVLEGRAPSMLELDDRPRAYEDVGRLCRWGAILDELKQAQRRLLPASALSPALQQYVLEREQQRPAAAAPAPAQPKPEPEQAKAPEPAPVRVSVRAPRAAVVARARTRSADSPADRRRNSGRLPDLLPERRRTRRRYTDRVVPFPDARLTRSTYEQVFLKLVSGERLKIGRDTYKPIGMRGWYHAIFRRDSDGKERLMSIDQLVKKMRDWEA